MARDVLANTDTSQTRCRATNLAVCHCCSANSNERILEMSLISTDYMIDSLIFKSTMPEMMSKLLPSVRLRSQMVNKSDVHGRLDQTSDDLVFKIDMLSS